MPRPMCLLEIKGDLGSEAISLRFILRVGWICLLGDLLLIVSLGCSMSMNRFDCSDRLFCVEAV